MPFLGLLVFRSHWFGVTSVKGLVVGLVLYFDSLLLPWVLKRHWVIAWLVVSVLGILASVTWPIHSKRAQDSVPEDFAFKELILRDEEKHWNRGTLPKTNCGAEPESAIAEPAEMERVVAKLAEAERVETERVEAESAQVESSQTSEAERVSVNGTTDSQSNEVKVQTKGLEELLDLGFAAKQAGRLTLAAEWFEEALKLNPESDLSVSLLVDIYWLWKVVHGEEMARVQWRALWHNQKGRNGEKTEILARLNQAGLSMEDLLK